MSADLSFFTVAYSLIYDANLEGSTLPITTIKDTPPKMLAKALTSFLTRVYMQLSLKGYSSIASIEREVLHRILLRNISVLDAR